MGGGKAGSPPESTSLSRRRKQEGDAKWKEGLGIWVFGWVFLFCLKLGISLVNVYAEGKELAEVRLKMAVREEGDGERSPLRPR